MKLKYDYKSILVNFFNKIFNIFHRSLKGETKFDIILNSIEKKGEGDKIKLLEKLQSDFPTNPIPTLKIAELLFRENNLKWINKSKEYLIKLENWKKKNYLYKTDQKQFVGEEFISGALGNYWDIKNLIDLNEIYLRRKGKICIIRKNFPKITNKVYFKYFKPKIKIIDKQNEIKKYDYINKITKIPMGFFLPVKSEPIFREFIPSLIIGKSQNKKFRYFKLDNNDTKKGAEFLKKVGLNKNSWFVTLHVREDNNKNTSENFRNSNPFNYIKAIKKITSNGGFVFRMGDKNSSMFPKMENFYDYAHSDFKSDLLDVFLAAKSKFCVGTPSGFYAVANSFGVPVLLTNVAQFSTYYSLHKQDILIPRLIQNKKKIKYLNLNNIFSGPYLWFYSDLQFKKKNVISIENDENDISDGVVDMMKKVFQNKKETKIQRKAKKIASKGIYKLYNKNIIPIANMGDSFLNKYRKDLV